MPIDRVVQAVGLVEIGHGLHVAIDPDLFAVLEILDHLARQVGDLLLVLGDRLRFGAVGRPLPGMVVVPVRAVGHVELLDLLEHAAAARPHHLCPACVRYERAGCPHALEVVLDQPDQVEPVGRAGEAEQAHRLGPQHALHETELAIHAQAGEAAHQVRRGRNDHRRHLRTYLQAGQAEAAGDRLVGRLEADLEARRVVGQALGRDPDVATFGRADIEVEQEGGNVPAVYLDHRATRPADRLELERKARHDRPERQVEAQRRSVARCEASSVMVEPAGLLAVLRAVACRVAALHFAQRDSHHRRDRQNACRIGLREAGVQRDGRGGCGRHRQHWRHLRHDGVAEQAVAGQVAFLPVRLHRGACVAVAEDRVAEHGIQLAHLAAQELARLVEVPDDLQAIVMHQVEQQQRREPGEQQARRPSLVEGQDRRLVAVMDRPQSAIGVAQHEPGGGDHDRVQGDGRHVGLVEPARAARFVQIDRAVHQDVLAQCGNRRLRQQVRPVAEHLAVGIGKPGPQHPGRVLDVEQQQVRLHPTYAPHGPALGQWRGRAGLGPGMRRRQGQGQGRLELPAADQAEIRTQREGHANLWLVTGSPAPSAMPATPEYFTNVTVLSRARNGSKVGSCRLPARYALSARDVA